MGFYPRNMGFLGVYPWKMGFYGILFSDSNFHFSALHNIYLQTALPMVYFSVGNSLTFSYSNFIDTKALNFLIIFKLSFTDGTFFSLSKLPSYTHLLGLTFFK